MNQFEGGLIMNEEKKMEFVNALTDLWVEDIISLCMFGKFKDAEVLASKMVGCVEAKKLVFDLRKIIFEGS